MVALGLLEVRGDVICAVVGVRGIEGEGGGIMGAFAGLAEAGTRPRIFRCSREAAALKPG